PCVLPEGASRMPRRSGVRHRAGALRETLLRVPAGVDLAKIAADQRDAAFSTTLPPWQTHSLNVESTTPLPLQLFMPAHPSLLPEHVLFPAHWLMPSHITLSPG